MRHIRFRAKSTESNDWVYGFYREYPIMKSCGECLDHKNYFIDHLTGGSDFIDPLTLGQFTGLLDANGENIYEGDILKMWLSDNVEPEGGFYHYMYVVFTSELGFVLWGDRMTLEDARPLSEGLAFSDCKIDGTIHDKNPLIKPININYLDK